jgi:hypothetical protein
MCAGSTCLDLVAMGTYTRSGPPDTATFAAYCLPARASCILPQYLLPLIEIEIISLYDNVNGPLCLANRAKSQVYLLRTLPVLHIR